MATALTDVRFRTKADKSRISRVDGLSAYDPQRTQGISVHKTHTCSLMLAVNLASKAIKMWVLP